MRATSGRERTTNLVTLILVTQLLCARCPDFKKKKQVSILCPNPIKFVACKILGTQACSGAHNKCS